LIYIIILIIGVRCCEIMDKTCLLVVFCSGDSCFKL